MNKVNTYLIEKNGAKCDVLDRNMYNIYVGIQI